ncbi:MAG: ribonuclease Y [Verrucomicrobia bacterium]|nr:ribonuclease Y [Verrucomicrobiota bacterium]
MLHLIGLTQNELTAATLGFFTACAVVLLVFLFFRSSFLEHRRSILREAENQSRVECDKILDEARNKASNLLQSAQDSARDLERKALEIERQVALRSAELEAQTLVHKREVAAFQNALLDFEEKQKLLLSHQNSVAERHKEYSQKLESLSGLSMDQLRLKILDEAKADCESEALAMEQRIVENAKANAENQARKIIAVAIHRYSGEYTFESTTSTLSLPNEEIKGRIIGREGRNIRAFEMATGITVLIDDTPNAVVLSGFDPVRREIAKVAMQKLISDGRIHPTRIEEVVEKSREEIEEVITRSGYEAQTKVQIPFFNQEITHLLGKLKFRLSYSQNILDHSIEVAQICGILASELGCDVRLAKQCGLLHDIGKAINHEKEGGHAIVGADFLKHHGVCAEVVNGVASHHFEVEPIGPYGVIVSAADAISASRPGARSETLSTYLNRIEALEKLADSHPGIKKSFAVHAGREIRVLANAEEIDDDGARKLARNLARSIEDQIQYPGQIRVTVIRETRCVEFAK